MITDSYPLRAYVTFSISLLILLTFAWVSCKKETGKAPPSIQLITLNGYTSDSVTVPIAFPYKIGITATKGDAAITNLVVTLTTENGIETALDSGIYAQGFSYEKSIAYGASLFETWTFMIRDKNGKSAGASVTIRKDTLSAFGPILYYPAVTLCTQNSLLPGSFFSVADGSLFTTENAGAYQLAVNIITYFGDQVVPPTDFTLSSPGDNDVASYFPMISGWTLPYNETRYKTDSLSISHEAFDAAYNDSLIITNYTSATVGKRKFKSVRNGYVIPFHVSKGASAGKRGLIKVNSIQDGPDGYVTVDIKVQK